MDTMNTTKTALAKKLGISRSSLYYRPKKPPKDQALKKEIETVMVANPAFRTSMIVGQVAIAWNQRIALHKLTQKDP